MMSNKGYVNWGTPILADNNNAPYIRDEGGITDTVSEHIVDIIEDHVEEIKPIIGGDVNYSTDEQNTHIKWFDGRYIYKKSFTYQASNLTYYQADGFLAGEIPLDIGNFKRITDVKVYIGSDVYNLIQTASDVIFVEANTVNNLGGTRKYIRWNVQLRENEEQPFIYFESSMDYLIDRTDNYTIYIDVKYTKT